jgi:TolA-binding protein
MAQAEAWLGARQFDEAARLAEDAQVLQPEGRINAEARILAGRIHAARGDHAEAARAFMTVAVLYDDETLSPEALRRAVAAYRRSQNSLEAEKALEELRRRYPAAEATPLEG